MKYIKVIPPKLQKTIKQEISLQVCDSLLAEVQAGATVDLTPILPQPKPAPAARSFSRDDPLPLQEAEQVQPDFDRDICTIIFKAPPGGADLYGAPAAPTTIAESLKQRMEKYQANPNIYP